MEQYIPKSALIAEIERIKEMYCYDQKTNASFVAEAVINSINNAINTLEVKEVDLCKEEERIWKDFNMGECHLSKNDLENIAKHFFELGMTVSNKAQKGE